MKLPQVCDGFLSIIHIIRICWRGTPAYKLPLIVLQRTKCEWAMHMTEGESRSHCNSSSIPTTSLLTESTITQSGVLPENTKPRFSAARTKAPSSVEQDSIWWGQVAVKSHWIKASGIWLLVHNTKQTNCWRWGGTTKTCGYLLSCDLSLQKSPAHAFHLSQTWSGKYSMHRCTDVKLKWVTSLAKPQS